MDYFYSSKLFSMNKFIVTVAFAGLSLSLFAQNSFVITPGAEVTVTGNATITLQNMNFVNNGIFTAGSGSVVMNGNTLSTISGSNSISFFNLMVNNTGGIHLGRNIIVTNQLDMGGMMNVKNNSIELGSAGTIVNESETNRITDDATNTGNITTVRNFASPLANVNPGNLGVEFVNAPALGNTTITRYAAAFVLNGSSTGLVSRYYNIQPTNNTALNASVRFYYLDTELNGVLESTAFLWKSTNNGISWSVITPDARNTTANFLQKDNVNDFSLWTIGSNNSALPVILSSFNTNCKENGANLVWKTEMELNSESFVIEKSADAINWKSIGTITAKGVAADYKFTDTEAGTAYYRLKQLDKNGTYTYSSVLRSDCEIKSITLLLYPNPATEYTDLVFHSDESFSTNIQVFAANGQIVQNIQSTIQKGANKIRINLNTLSNGTYIIKINDSKLKLAKTFVKH
jgi:hypothetical protein